MMASKIFFTKKNYHIIQQFHSYGYTSKKKKTNFKVCPIVHNTIAYHCTIWKKPGCPSTDECIRSGVYIYIYIMEYHSAIRKNEILPLAETYMDLESIILSEINQTERKTSTDDIS